MNPTLARELNRQVNQATEEERNREKVTADNQVRRVRFGEQILLMKELEAPGFYHLLESESEPSPGWGIVTPVGEVFRFGEQLGWIWDLELISESEEVNAT